MINSKSSVLFATFSLWANGQRMPTNGNLEPLRNYLVKRSCRVVLVDQPHPGSEIVMPIIEEYLGKNIHQVRVSKPALWIRLMGPILSKTNKNQTNLLFKVRDFLSVFDCGTRENGHFDYFVGVEGVNALAGIFLKKLGRIDKVIYYVLDYSPNRFTPLLNSLYLKLDRFCVKNSDFVWDVSKAIHPARVASGLRPGESTKVIHVPIGVYPNQLITTPIYKRSPFSMCYMGTLTSEQGPDLAIEAAALVVKKYPEAVLHIVGGGQENLERLKKVTRGLFLDKNVRFYGFVPKSIDMARILSRCLVGLAPYRQMPGSIRQYADASKLRSYAACALPIITTTIPPLGKELQEVGGAIVVKDNSKEFSKAIDMLFSNQKLYAKMRKSVIRFSKENTWDNEFDKAFAKSQ